LTASCASYAISRANKPRLSISRWAITKSTRCRSGFNPTCRAEARPTSQWTIWDKSGFIGKRASLLSGSFHCARARVMFFDEGRIQYQSNLTLLISLFEERIAA
jgi:hypothetical protein